MVKILNLFIGFMLFMSFTVVLFGDENDGAVGIANDYSVAIAAEHQNTIDDAQFYGSTSNLNDLANTNPAGAEGGLDDGVDSDTGGIDFLGLKSFFKIFNMHNDFKNVVDGDEGVATRLNIDPRLKYTFLTILGLTLAIILIQAFTKNTLRT